MATNNPGNGGPPNPFNYCNPHDRHSHAIFGQALIANLVLLVQTLWTAATTLGDTVMLCYNAIAFIFPDGTAPHPFVQFMPYDGPTHLPGDAGPAPPPTPVPNPIPNDMPAPPIPNNIPVPNVIPGHLPVPQDDIAAPPPNLAANNNPVPAADPVADNIPAPGPEPDVEPACKASGQQQQPPANFTIRDPTPEEIEFGGHLPQTGGTRFYAVTCGTAVGIFQDWLAALPHVTGVPCAIYCRYNTRYDAQNAWQWAVQHGMVKIVIMG